MAHRVYLGIDMGASSGRHMAGLFDGERLTLKELHRFENGPVEAAGRLHWDLLRLWTEVLDGLRASADKLGKEIVSVGVDTWGVDYGLIGPGDVILGNPYQYRDPSFAEAYEATLRQVPREEIFRHTGLQFMQINTLYQLMAMKRSGSPLLASAESLLMMADLFHWLLSGEKSNEMTNSSTTQFFNPATGDWAYELLEKLDLPTKILGPITQPGTTLGKLRGEVAKQVGLPETNVVLPPTHDTGAAVMAVPATWPPAENPNWCYISLGTWALMGLEAPRPVIDETVLDLNFTNEGGVGGTSRVLKNITGLWLLQECRRIWNRAGNDLSWGDIAALAASAPPCRSLVYPDSPELMAPTDMPEAIAALCQRTGQPVPQDIAATARCILDSLALRFRQVLELCEKLAGGRIETIHIVGGGTRNELLCRLTADATGRRVVAGPVEATAIGNVMMQCVASGDVADIGEARDVIRRSFHVTEYEPGDRAPWDDAYPRLVELAGAG